MFIVGDTLFLLEWKAFSQNPRIEQGDFAALRDRWKTLRRKYLKQVRTLKEFIEQRRADRDVAVPPRSPGSSTPSARLPSSGSRTDRPSRG
jgi:hypothetical protein